MKELLVSLSDLFTALASSYEPLSGEGLRSILDKLDDLQDQLIKQGRDMTTIQEIFQAQQRGQAAITAALDAISVEVSELAVKLQEAQAGQVTQEELAQVLANTESMTERIGLIKQSVEAIVPTTATPTDPPVPPDTVSGGGTTDTVTGGAGDTVTGGGDAGTGADVVDLPSGNIDLGEVNVGESPDDVTLPGVPSIDINPSDTPQEEPVGLPSTML